MTPGIVVDVPNQEKTPRRTVRVPNEVWQPAGQKARDNDENVSEVIRRALTDYIRDDPPVSTTPGPNTSSRPAGERPPHDRMAT